MLTSTKPAVADLRRPHRLRQEPDDAPRRGAAARVGQARRRAAASDALRRPDEAGRAAIRALRGPRRGRRDDRGTRGVRAAHRRGQPRLRRHRLRRDPRPGRAGGGRDPLGRRQQRHPVREAERPHRRRRPAPPGHELRYHPGETNLRMADVCVVNKVDSATAGRDRRGARLDPHPQPRREDRARGLAVPRRGRRGRDRRQARARDRGRADPDPRRDDLRRRRPRRQGERRRRARRSARLRPSARSRRPSRTTRTSARCSRRWATAASRWTT